jgi:copper transporter 1
MSLSKRLTHIRAQIITNALLTRQRPVRLGMANLWFAGWTPTTAGATAGAALGLFLLAILSRLLAVVSTSAEAAWSQSIALQRSASRLGVVPTLVSSKGEKEKDNLSPSSSSASSHLSSPSLLLAPPFIPSIDIPRALLLMFQAFVGYLLMLAVMTYNAWFFIAILLGFGVGELAFGRMMGRHSSYSAIHL